MNTNQFYAALFLFPAFLCLGFAIHLDGTGRVAFSLLSVLCFGLSALSVSKDIPQNTLNTHRALEKAKQDRKYLEHWVTDLSQQLEHYIGPANKNVPNNFKFTQLKNYDIIKESRCFSDGWVDIWEIVEKGKCAHSTSWVKWQGTATMNNPPSSVVIDVLNQLNKLN